MTSAASALTSARRILLIVNSRGADGEIDRVLEAIGRYADYSRLSAIVPAALMGAMAGRGVSAGALMPYELEIGFVLQSARVVQWAIRQDADVIIGSEPYAPGNEEVKTPFELRVAAMLGQGTLLAHSLPDDQAVLLAAEDLWRRAARADDVGEHRARIGHTLARLHAAWSRDTHTPINEAQAIAVDGLAIPGVTSDQPPPSMVQAWLWSYERLHDALRSDGGYPPAPVRVLTDPAGALPSAGWLGGRLEPIRRPAHQAAGLHLHGLGLSFRGTASEPFASVLMSRFVNLERGDAAVAEGRVHHGGVTIGLVKGETWASRVDIVERGRFLAAAIATERGSYAVVVAHCLTGTDRRTALAIRRVGIRRAGN